MMLVKTNPMRSFVSPFRVFENELAPRTFSPRVDLRETDKAYVIDAEMPGLKRDDFKLTLEDDVLTLQGEKKIEREDKDDGYYRSERSYGQFRRAFRLGENIDRNKVKADYRNGVLTITLPKTEKAKAKAIDVKIS